MSAAGPTSTAAVAADDTLKLVLPGKSVPAGAGITWIGTGWTLFAKAPLMWIVALLILFVIAIVVSLVPIIGSLAFQILNPVFSAGLIVACRSLERGGDFELEHLFAGFKIQFANLVVVGLLFLLGWVLILAVCAMIVGFGVLSAVLSGSAQDVAPMLAASGLSFLLALLVMLALMVPLLMLYWFAPALVVMHGMSPIAAMKASFGACLRDFLPFLVYGVVMTVLAVLAVIPLGLGMLVWVPLCITTTYAAYRDIFTEEAGAATTVAMA
jgi:uncharacterized membrane protein